MGATALAGLSTVAGASIFSFGPYEGIEKFQPRPPLTPENIRDFIMDRIFKSSQFFTREAFHDCAALSLSDFGEKYKSQIHLASFALGNREVQFDFRDFIDLASNWPRDLIAWMFKQAGENVTNEYKNLTYTTEFNHLYLVFQFGQQGVPEDTQQLTKYYTNPRLRNNAQSIHNVIEAHSTTPNGKINVVLTGYLATEMVGGNYAKVRDDLFLPKAGHGTIPRGYDARYTRYDRLWQGSIVGALPLLLKAMIVGYHVNSRDLSYNPQPRNESMANGNSIIELMTRVMGLGIPADVSKGVSVINGATRLLPGIGHFKENQENFADQNVLNPRQHNLVDYVTHLLHWHEAMFCRIPERRTYEYIKGYKPPERPKFIFVPKDGSVPT